MQLGIGVEHFTHVSLGGENSKIKINYFNITISFTYMHLCSLFH